MMLKVSGVILAKRLDSLVLRLGVGVGQIEEIGEESWD